MNPSSKTLLDLNDDCLIEILQYLTINDTFNLMILHPRFQEVCYERIAQLKHLEVNLRDETDIEKWKLEIIGQNLRSLYITAGYSLPTDSVLHYLQPICSKATQLKNIKLQYLHFDEECQKCLLAIAEKIEDLNLNYSQLTDEILGPILENCRNLKYLSLLGNYTLKCESLFKYLKSRPLKEVQVEENAFSRDAIQTYIAENPQVSVKVYSQGRLNFNVYGPSME